MPTDRFALSIAALLVASVLAGCGPNKDTVERERLESQAEKDQAKANQAITKMNQKIFGAMNSQGVSPTPAPTASLDNPKP
jgi:ABC-type uncharacterized transport system auxiliary subunit